MSFMEKIIVFSILLFTIISYLFYVKLILQFFNVNKEQVLVIGILSAPENFEQRQSIRKTWLKLTSYVPAKHYFLIGRENCEVYPLDRLTPYSCVQNNVILPKDVDSKTTFTTITEQSKLDRSSQPVIGFGFYVVHDIIITKLGITSRLLKKATSMKQIKLLSSFDKSVLSSVTFYPDKNTTASGLAYKKIKQIRLPKQYEAMVVVESFDNNEIIESCFDLMWNTEPGIISITQIISNGKERPSPFKVNTCPHVFMDFNIADVNKLKKFQNFKETRKKEQKDLNEKLSSQLKNEYKEYNDLMFLDVVDVYENLPEKMIQFYLRILEENNFKYILKTDDDSFIDLLRVQNHLQKFENNSSEREMWWWSYFKEFWAVPSSGKWKDNKYRSVSYPPFPCGGGYVINKEIADYIAGNFNYLQRFQGEDISLGLWLSGLHVRRPEKFSREFFIQEFIRNKFRERNRLKFLTIEQCPNFKKVVDGCEWTCDNKRRNDMPLCNKVQLSVGEMYETWEEFKVDGYL